MKKLVFVLAILLSACSSVKKDEFVNPIFYKTMYPIPITAWETKLTPTSYISQNKGLKITGDCILLENEQDHIKLKCEMQYPGKTKILTKIRKYELLTDIDPYTYDENEQKIIEYGLENETSENFSSQISFYINLKE